MSILVNTPEGGAIAELGGETRQLLLRNAEIERFEVQHGLGIYQLLDDLMHNRAQVRHCRDIVALALVGAGKTNIEADAIVSSLPTHANFAIRSAAQEVLFAAFVDPDAIKKKADGSVGEALTSPPTTTPKTKQKTQSAQE